MASTMFILGAAELESLRRSAKRLYSQDRLDGDGMRDLAQKLDGIVASAVPLDDEGPQNATASTATGIIATELRKCVNLGSLGERWLRECRERGTYTPILALAVMDDDVLQAILTVRAEYLDSRGKDPVGCDVPRTIAGEDPASDRRRR